MEFRILGPLEVVDEGRLVRLAGAKQSRLLGLLLLHANEVVASERLVEELWGGRSSVRANTLHSRVSELRKALGPRSGEILVTHAPGYVLRVATGELDSARFEALAEEGRRTLASGDAERAATLLRDALALWRGPALVDFAYEPFAQAEISHLENLRLAGLETRIEADLALGRHAELVGEVEALVARAPLRERLRGQLMLALYRSGRQAEALEAYNEGRRVLAEELALEPSPSLKRLERAILNQDRELELPASSELGGAALHKPAPAQSREIPETRYATALDGTHLAYKVFGDGPVDLVYLQWWFSHIEYIWEEPRYERFLRAFALFSRVILFDRRGSGMSDPVPMDRTPDLKTRVDDARAVMDHVGSQRAVVYGASESGRLACLFAAMHPDRTVALLVHGSRARRAWAPDYPWGVTKEEHEADVASIERAWGTEALVRKYFPRLTPDEPLVRWMATLCRYTMSPGAAAAYERLTYEDDVRDMLPAIHVPTLILHREHDSPEENRYIADHIPQAEYLPLPGDEHIPYLGHQDSVTSAIERFVRSVQDENRVRERTLAAVLFTDIVGPTAVAQLRGPAWGEVVERYHATVRGLLARYRGVEVDTAGERFLATFDGPVRAAKCASAIVKAVRPLGIEVRAGLHTGEVESIAGKVSGMAVVIGSRVAAAASASEVLASQTMKDVTAGSGLVFEDAGEHDLKGVPDRWRLYRVLG